MIKIRIGDQIVSLPTLKGADGKSAYQYALEAGFMGTEQEFINLLIEGTDLINSHLTDSEAHNDIRKLINTLSIRLNAVADSDDITLDQLSEIVAYIKSNKDLIDAITTSKVSVSVFEEEMQNLEDKIVTPDWQAKANEKGYIKNRTHYETKPEFNISWDGEIDNKFVLDMASLGYEGFKFVKVSDEVLTREKLVGATYIQNTGYKLTISENDLDSTKYPGAITVGDESFIIVYSAEETNNALGLTPDGLTNGIYFLSTSYDNGLVIYTERLIAHTEVMKLDKKFLPEDTVYQSDLETYVEQAIVEGNVQGDMLQNDHSQPDYIKNRTHYESVLDTSSILSTPVAGVNMLKDISELSMDDRNRLYGFDNTTVNTTGSVYTLVWFTAGGMVNTFIESPEKIDNVNYAYGLSSSYIVYFILDITALTEENVAKFPLAGIYLECKDGVENSLSNVYVETRSIEKKIDKRFLPSDLLGGAVATDEEVLDMIASLDGINLVVDENGSVLTDENSNIIIW